jgi:hypothetical protein
LIKDREMFENVWTCTYTHADQKSVPAVVPARRCFAGSKGGAKMTATKPRSV